MTSLTFCSLYLPSKELPIKKYLERKSLKIERSPGDGHCLVHSVTTSLDQVGVVISSSQILQRCREELEDHSDIYNAFYNGKDLLEEFDFHASSNEYNLQIVDIMLQAIANCVEKKRFVFLTSGVIQLLSRISTERQYQPVKMFHFTAWGTF